MLVNRTNSRHFKLKLIHSPLEGKSTQAVVVHAAPTPSPAYSGLNKEKGMGKERGRGRGGGVSGRQKDRGVQPCRMSPLASSAFF
eukprot:scaffold3007_cov158-Isochrysis_galbana.AAC.2